MSKPRLLDAYTPTSETISAVTNNYSIVAGWSDGNPDTENRVGYFVSKDLNTPDVSLIKSTRDSKILGVTVESSGFASNVNKSMCDERGILLPRYSYVCFAGFAKVIDDGTCEVNGVCVSSDEGIAVPSNNDYGYKVVNRIDNNHITIMIESQGDTIPRLVNRLSARVEGSVLRIGL